MKLTATIKLLPTPEQAAALDAMLRCCNEAATWISAQGAQAGIFRQFALHKFAYRDARARYGLTAQATVRAIAKAADAFKLSKAPSTFRRFGAFPFDCQMMRFVQGGGAVSLQTLGGRIVVPVVMGERQRGLMAFRRGEADLCFVRGKWMLACTCDVPEAEPRAEDWLGVDLGIVNIAADSDGRVYTGERVERVRSKLARRRAGLQRRGTKAAKRRLRALSRKQRRFQDHESHCIAKALVLTAERTGRGIALEELKGLRGRVTARRSQRARLNNWGFAKLRRFVAYKAALAGVPVVAVDRRQTSTMCSHCGIADHASRTSQATFSCTSCGHTEPADLNAARNIRARATAAAPLCSPPRACA